MPIGTFVILLCLTPDDFTRQRRLGEPLDGGGLNYHFSCKSFHIYCITLHNYIVLYISVISSTYQTICSSSLILVCTISHISKYYRECHSKHSRNWQYTKKPPDTKKQVINIGYEQSWLYTVWPVKRYFMQELTV